MPFSSSFDDALGVRPLRAPAGDLVDLVDEQHQVLDARRPGRRTRAGPPPARPAPRPRAGSGRSRGRASRAGRRRALAKVVLPVPGARTAPPPSAGTTPCRAASSGSASGSTTRRSMSALVSSIPARSSQAAASIRRPPRALSASRSAGAQRLALLEVLDARGERVALVQEGLVAHPAPRAAAPRCAARPCAAAAPPARAAAPSPMPSWRAVGVDRDAHHPGPLAGDPGHAGPHHPPVAHGDHRGLPAPEGLDHLRHHERAARGRPRPTRSRRPPPRRGRTASKSRMWGTAMGDLRGRAAGGA